MYVIGAYCRMINSEQTNVGPFKLFTIHLFTVSGRPDFRFLFPCISLFSVLFLSFPRAKVIKIPITVENARTHCQLHGIFNSYISDVQSSFTYASSAH